MTTLECWQLLGKRGTVGEAARITGETGLGLTATAGPTEEEPAEVLIWELPA
ncbi:hypothetical protein [Streptomyces sp. NPDC057545]|uniref:hypothetical protein n=1 Tax=unclassified Streptomyces TaxID=2593676 RepID=UPI00368476D7